MPVTTPTDPPVKGPLRAAMNRAREELAEATDNVVDLQTSETARLQLLADGLQPLFGDIDPADERFELVLSHGTRPRLWLDMTAFVAMGRDRRTYRLLKDTRMGRVVLGEEREREDMETLVADYVARKVLEREWVMEGEWQAVQAGAPTTAMPAERQATAAMAARSQDARKARKPKKGRGVLWFVLGLLGGVAAVIATAYALVPQVFERFLG